MEMFFVMRFACISDAKERRAEGRGEDIPCADASRRGWKIGEKSSSLEEENLPKMSLLTCR